MGKQKCGKRRLTARERARDERFLVRLTDGKQKDTRAGLELKADVQEKGAGRHVFTVPPYDWLRQRQAG